MTKIKNVWNWLWQGRLCRKCKLERTYRRFIDDTCFTCDVVTLIKWRAGIQ